MKRVLALSLVILLALFCVYESPASMHIGLALGRMAAHLHRHEAEVGGEHWVWLEGGQSKDLVVLVHGFGADKDDWDFFAHALQMHVVVPDLPGFGESDRDPAKSYDVASQADRLHAFFQAQGLKHFHLVGNSMGGAISSYYAWKYPEDVITLGLFDSGGVTSPHKSELSAALARGENPLIVDSPEGVEHLLAFAFVHPPFIPAPMKRAAAAHFAAAAAFNKKIFSDLMEKKPVGMEPLLAAIQTPTLVLWGDTDRIIDSSAADVFMSGLPHATKVILKDCGHAPMMERPVETAEQYRAFLQAH